MTILKLFLGGSIAELVLLEVLIIVLVLVLILTPNCAGGGEGLSFEDIIMSHMIDYP